MDPRPERSGAPHAGRGFSVLAACAIALAVALGVVLRLADPLSSPVVPAEDPYTHMALVREHLRTGTLDPLDASQTLYPPGLHAFLASVWVYTGADLYGLILLGPVVFGAIGILGMAILLWRTAGPLAAFVAALAMAVAPEAIFRTTMMSPTALDFAIIPFFLVALLRVVAGRLGWVGVAAPAALFVAILHPWLLAILCLAGAVFLVTLLPLRWPASRGEPPTTSGLFAAMAILGSSLGVAILMPGFGGVLGLSRDTGLVALGIGVAIAACMPMFVRMWWRRRRAAAAQRAPAVPRAPVGRAVRFGFSASIAAGLSLTIWLALLQGLPDFVDLPRMVGWPILILAFAALVALPFLSSPVANLAGALFAATFPFVVFNPFQSEFLPHRTAAFLILALVMLVGVAAGGLSRLAIWAANAWKTRARASTSPTPGAPRPILYAALPGLLVATLLAGAVYAGTPDGYPGGWYRLYSSCELEALQEVARFADAAPTAVVVVGDWQAKLVLAALASDAGRIWYKEAMFVSDRARDDFVAAMQHEGRPVIVVLDRYLRSETPEANTQFVEQPPWQSLGSWCGGTALGVPRVAAYADSRGATP